MEEENYGISKEHAHKRAIELVPEEFFGTAPMSWLLLVLMREIRP